MNCFSLYHTVHSFVEVTTQLLGVPGVTYLLSERFNQDPVEAVFGKQRYKGRRSDNLSVKEFLDNTVSLPDNSACSGGQHAVLNSVCYVKISDCCLDEEIRYTHVQSCSQLEHDIISMLQRQLLARRGQI